jgi:hypothetical protein
MNDEDLDDALHEIARGDVVYGPALVRSSQGPSSASNAVRRDVRPLVGLLPPGQGVIATYKKSDDMEVEAIIRYPDKRQQSLSGMDPIRAGVEATGTHVVPLLGRAQELIRRAQQGRLTLDALRAEREKVGKQASILDGVLVLAQRPPQQLKIGDQLLAVGGMVLDDPWLRGRTERVVARVQEVTFPKAKLLVAVDQVSPSVGGRSTRPTSKSRRQDGVLQSCRRWQKRAGHVSTLMDAVLLAVAQHRGCSVTANLTETQRLGDQRVVFRVDAVKVDASVLRQLQSDLQQRLDSSNQLAELDFG